jgi:hypothetical protein
VAVDDPKLELYLLRTVDQSIRPNAQVQVHEALRQVARGLWPSHAQGLRLTALRRYLRFQNRDHKDIHESWAWTPTQAEQLIREEPARTLFQRAAVVQAAFAASNPGYRLEISRVRSLESQVQKWNDNAGVRVAAAALLVKMLAELGDAEYATPPTRENVARFSARLEATVINPEPGNAAPGISSHGQMRAVDFIVLQGAQIVATTSTASVATIWRGQRWEEKLIAAVQAASKKGAALKGPLKVPDEPWHWSLP